MPRPWSEVGKRGQILLVFGLLWLVSGVGELTRAETPAAWANIPMFREVPMGWAWLLTGCVALAYAFRPTTITHDGIGFLALYLLPAYRASGYVIGWLDSLVPGVGSAGYPLGWLTALVHLAIAAAIMICASWPEPPRAGPGCDHEVQS